MGPESVLPAETGPPPLLIGLFDDAALFPPGNAPMPRAVAEHRAHESSGHAGLVGPFVCLDSRLLELLDELARRQSPGALPVSIVVSGGPGAIEAVGREVAGRDTVRLVALEVPLGPGAGAPGRAAQAAERLEELSPAVAGYVEVPPGDERRAVLEVLAAHGVRAKLRTGGPVPASFPPDGEVAAFIHDCADRQLAFKCTAGLHSGVRHDVAGRAGEVMEQQGFLNIVLATAASLDGATVPELAAVLGERDEALVAKAVAGLDAPQVARGRRRFLSFGTCSVYEPIVDLVRLGLLEPRFAAP
jgi:hypothetical protein